MFMTKKQRLTVKASAGMFVSAFFLDHGGVYLFTGNKRPVLPHMAVPCASRLMLTVFFRATFHHCDCFEVHYEFAIGQQNKDTQNKRKISTVLLSDLTSTPLFRLTFSISAFVSLLALLA